MRSVWALLFADISKSILSPVAEGRFLRVAARHKALAEFTTPAALLAYQRRRWREPERANSVLHALVAEYQRGSPRDRDLAGAILFVAMELALTRVFNRVRPHFDSDGDAVGAVGLRFYEQVATWPLEQTDHVAASLQEKMQRRVMAERSRLFNDRKRARIVTTYADAIDETYGSSSAVVDLDDDESDPHESRQQGSARNFWRSQTEERPRFDFDDKEIFWLRATLVRIAGITNDEATLLVLKRPCRWSWVEIGQYFGIKPETARKRHQTLLRRLPLEEIEQADLPGFEIGLRTKGVGGQDVPEQTRRKR